MPIGQIITMEVAPGTENKTWTEIERGTPAVVPGMGIEMEPGVLYETQYVADNPITSTISQINAWIGSAIATFYGVRTEYIIVEGDTLRHGYMIPSSYAATARAFGLPVIGGIITAVMAVLIIGGIILIILGMWLGKNPIQLLMEMIPGMIVTVVGGVVTSVLPGKIRLVGLVPIGIGMWMLLQPLMPSDGEEQRCSQYTNQVDCEAEGCYWWGDGTCHSTAQPVEQVLIKDVIAD